MVEAMEMQESFKKTGVGIIPSDWKVTTIDEISEVKSGKRLPLGKALANRETSHPYIRVADMFMGGVSLNDIKYVPDDVYPSIKNYCIFFDDIFISVAGTLGVVGKIPYGLDGANLTENADRLTNISCDRDYLLYVLMSWLIQNKIGAEKTLGAQPKLALTRIRKFPIPLPPTKAEQTAIAAALNDADTLITQLEKLIAKKRAVKKGAMQELLTGKRRLLGFEKIKGYKQTEVGVIPNDWKVKKLSEIGESIIGLTYSPANVKSHGTLVLRSSNVQNGKLAFENNVFVEMDLPKRVIVKENDILICVRNGSRQLIGKCALIDKKTDGSAFGAFMSVYRSEFSVFAFHQFQSFFIQKQINETLGATINQITNKDLARFQIPFPPTKAEQTAIAQILFDMDVEIEALEKKLDKYKMIKQGMMQNLLTGRIRLV